MKHLLLILTLSVAGGCAGLLPPGAGDSGSIDERDPPITLTAPPGTPKIIVQPAKPPAPPSPMDLLLPLAAAGLSAFVGRDVVRSLALIGAKFLNGNRKLTKEIRIQSGKKK